MISFVCFLLIANISLAQHNPADALNEAPLRVQSWFYQRYDNVSEVVWIRKKIDGELHHEASFDFKGNSVVALYDDEGEIKEEIIFNKKPVLTAGIKIYIDQNFTKFKLAGLKSVKLFRNSGKEFTAYYELLGKDRHEEISFWFNGNNEIINKSDFANYASLD